MILAEVQQGNSNRVTESIRATDGLHGDDGTPVERMREANVRTALGGSARDGMVAGDQGAAQSTLEKSDWVLLLFQQPNRSKNSKNKWSALVDKAC